MNDADDEIIFCVINIESTKDILVERWNVTAYKAGGVVQKATAMKAALGSVKSVDWAKEEEELKVMAKVLRDLWQESKEDVQVQIERGLQHVSKTNNRIGKIESAITIVTMSIKNNKKRQKLYSQAKKKRNKK